MVIEYVSQLDTTIILVFVGTRPNLPEFDRENPLLKVSG